MSETQPTVLIADDEPDIRDALVEVLTDGGYKVAVARDGAEALSLLRSLVPEVALVDVQMPGLSGTEVLEQASLAGDATRVILMTAYPNATVESTALRLNAHAFLSKPVNLDVLLAAITSAVRVHSVESENKRVLAAHQAREEALRVAVETAEERAERLDALHALAVLSGESLDLDEVITRSVRLVERLFSGRAEVRLYDEDEGALDDSVWPNADVDEIAQEAARKEAVVFADGENGGALASVPLLMRGRLIGVLSFASDVPLQQRLKTLLPRLGGTLAMALDNAMRFHRAKDAFANAQDVHARQIESERLAVIGQMTAGLAHELNTPLSYLLANLHTLRRGLSGLPAESSVSEWATLLDECVGSTERIRDTVRDLRQFGRDGTGSLQPADLNETVEQSLGLLQSEFVRNTKLEKNLGDVPIIGAHPGRLAQAIVQLLRNAMQAVRPGAAEQRVELTTGVVDGKAFVRVRDHGTGMSAEVLSRAFEPFFSTKQVGQGVGLGLSMALDVARHHGGELLLDSTLGAGTTAEIRLPLRVPAQLEEPEKPRLAGRRRILVVDEDRFILLAFSRLVGRHHDVVTVGGGRAALAVLETDDAFDLVLCDLNMPDMTGPDVYEELARNRPSILPRFAVFTGGALDERQSKLIDALGPRVLEKPFAMEALERLLTHVA